MNVLIYMSDEHNPLVSSVYGHPVVSTPNMERLAVGGTVFENAYCPSPLCLPSRSSFMSGRPVHQIQAYNNCTAITAELPSYGGVLGGQGVHTAYAGKVDVYNHSSTLGFAEMILPGDRKSPGDTNFGRTPLVVRRGARKRGAQYGPMPRAFARDERVIDKAVEWLLGTGRQTTGPWTLTVNTGKPHFPHHVTAELWEKYAEHGDMPVYGRECTSAKHPYAEDLRAHFEADHFTESQIRGLRRGYLGCVDYTDHCLGRLIDALEASGQSSDTVIVYTADHGEMLGKFGMWWKCSLYEDSVRVPLIVAGPGFASGQRIKTPVSLLDLQATVFRTVQRERPKDWWGTPLQDVPENDPGRVVFAEYHGHGTRSGAYMIRKGRWKLIFYMAGPHQLFDLEADPDELDNLADTERDVFDELERDLRRLCSPEEENQRAHAFEREQQAAVDA